MTHPIGLSMLAYCNSLVILLGQVHSEIVDSGMYRNVLPEEKRTIHVIRKNEQ